MPHTEDTIAWYMRWLEERNPEWSPEQRLEVATGFAVLQQPPTALPTIEDIVALDEEAVAASKREADRAAERSNRKYLTGDELIAILNTPSAVPKVN